MTDVQPKPLPPAPRDPYDNVDIRVLTDGDTCDDRGWPAIATVRAYIYHNGDKDNLAGILHWCSHHWRTHADTIWQMTLDGKAGLIDESHWAEARA